MLNFMLTDLREGFSKIEKCTSRFFDSTTTSSRQTRTYGQSRNLQSIIRWNLDGEFIRPNKYPSKIKYCRTFHCTSTILESNGIYFTDMPYFNQFSATSTYPSNRCVQRRKVTKTILMTKVAKSQRFSSNRCSKITEKTAYHQPVFADKSASKNQHTLLAEWNNLKHTIKSYQNF